MPPWLEQAQNNAPASWGELCLLSRSCLIISFVLGPIGGLCEAIQTLQEAVSQSNTSPTRKSLAKSLACAIDGMPTESFHAVSDYRPNDLCKAGAARVYLALALDAHELGDSRTLGYASRLFCFARVRKLIH